MGKKNGFADSEVAKVRSLLSQYRSVEYAQGVAASYAESARRLLETAKVGTTRGKLLELSEYLSSRKY